MDDLIMMLQQRHYEYIFKAIQFLNEKLNQNLRLSGLFLDRARDLADMVGLAIENTLTS